MLGPQFHLALIKRRSLEAFYHLLSFLRGTGTSCDLGCLILRIFVLFYRMPIDGYILVLVLQLLFPSIS